nr:PREDICTED: uncharacterized protein LOC105663527 [Megachile rotundata]
MLLNKYIYSVEFYNSLSLSIPNDLPKACGKRRQAESELNRKESKEHNKPGKSEKLFMMVMILRLINSDFQKCLFPCVFLLIKVWNNTDQSLNFTGAHKKYPKVPERHQYVPQYIAKQNILSKQYFHRLLHHLKLVASNINSSS